MTSQAGLLIVAELAAALGLPEATERAVSVKQRNRGYSEWEFTESLLLMMLAGGDCVDDLSKLAADEGLVRGLGHEIPSPSSAKKHLYGFHDDSLDESHSHQRELMPSFVPPENGPLLGLEQVNRHLVRQAQRSNPQRTATLDHDGTIIGSTKRVAATTYKGEKGYQPSIILWVEQDLIVADEFRDGNVPAGNNVLRVARRAFDALPEGVQRVYYRADSASYNHELLNWLRDDGNGNSRAIFGISAIMSPELRKAAVAVEEWHADPDDACRSWGEIDFVPSAPSVKKGRKPDRYLAIRIRPRQRELFADGSEEKYLAIVTNDFERDGLEIIKWHREKAGTIEHVNHVLKNELAVGVLPCERFGSNAAWLRLNVLAYNLLSVLRHTALPKELRTARPKRLRFLVFNQAAEIIHHARRLIVRVATSVRGLLVRLCDVRRLLWQTALIWET